MGHSVNIPPKVKIGPYVYDIEFIDSPVARKKDYVKTGEIDYDKGIIRIWNGKSKKNPRGNPSRALAVFFHEALHGLAELAQVDLKEKEVAILGPLLAEFLIANGFVQFVESSEVTREHAFRPASVAGNGRTPDRVVYVGPTQTPSPDGFDASFHSEVPDTASPTMRRALNLDDTEGINGRNGE
jgi:hypothetical protein